MLAYRQTQISRGRIIIVEEIVNVQSISNSEV
jgi:hypothetical protein